jgi:hypothetical protein
VVASVNGWPAVLQRIVFATPINHIGALVGDSTPACVAVIAGVTGRYIKKAQRRAENGCRKYQFGNDNPHREGLRSKNNFSRPRRRESGENAIQWATRIKMRGIVAFKSRRGVWGKKQSRWLVLQGLAAFAVSALRLAQQLRQLGDIRRDRRSSLRVSNEITFMAGN